jgi:anti-sigma factor RsiW
MNCHELETLLCDYVDGTLPPERKAAVERHLAECPSCTEMAADSAAAVAFIESAAPVEPPPELITKILYDLDAAREKALPSKRSLLTLLGHWMGPVLQPRFVMGMAMTILSFSMLARFAGINVRQLSLSDLDPVRVWRSVDDRVQRGWTRGVKFYESMRLVYEIRSRLGELTAQQEQDAGAASKQTGGQGAPKQDQNKK